MDANLFEQLLYEEESTTLDFKRDQYPFAKASDDEKSELIKDIMAFANAWRRADAYILIGVDETRGDKSNVVGVTDHLDDHSLQQFVNGRTNRPIEFSYEAFGVDGKQVGIIKVDGQNRPIYLKRDFGRLNKNVVYLRRGSSTCVASVDEIARMGASGTSSSSEAEISIEFADPKQQDSLGCQIPWSAELCNVPKTEDIPKLIRRRQANALGIDFDAIQAVTSYEYLNELFYREMADYEFVRRLYRQVRLVITNTGKVGANDVRVELTVPMGKGIGISGSSGIPERPEKRKSRLDFPAMKHIRPAMRHAGAVDIEADDARFKLEIDCGNLQPGRKVWSDDFYVFVADTGEFRLEGHIFAENLPEPKAFTLTINADITKTSMTVDELIDLAEPRNEDDIDDEDEDT